MQTLSSSLGQKRPRSPGMQFDSVRGGKRRATINDKPMLYVDTRVPPRPTPELAFFPTTSPFRPSTTYTDTIDYSTGQEWAQQNMRYPATENWMQRTGAMHSTMCTDKLQYHSETGFSEACKSSVESSSSYSIFSVLSTLSSSHNPFEDLCSTLPPDSLSSLSNQTETNMNDSIKTVTARLRKLQDVWAEQSRMLEEVIQVLQVSRRP
jgi:hypothetical protein